MYRLIVLIGLVFVCLGSWISGILGIERKTEVKTAPVNGSLSAVDALGRETVSAGESDKKVGVFYFLWNGEHNLDGPYDVPKICVFTTGEYDHNVLSRGRIREICTAKMYFTAREDGVLALLGENGDVRCYGQIH